MSPIMHTVHQFTQGHRSITVVLKKVLYNVFGVLQDTASRWSTPTIQIGTRYPSVEQTYMLLLVLGGVPDVHARLSWEPYQVIATVQYCILLHLTRAYK